MYINNRGVYLLESNERRHLVIQTKYQKKNKVGKRQKRKRLTIFVKGKIRDPLLCWYKPSCPVMYLYVTKIDGLTQKTLMYMYSKVLLIKNFIILK